MTLQRHWAAKYVGTPWSAEHNCWWLVREIVRQQWGHELPEVAVGATVSQVAPIMQAASVAGWRPVSGPPREGDILVGVDRKSGKRHAGVMVQSRSRGLLLLHSSSGIGYAIAQPLADAHLRDTELWRPHATR